MKWIKIEDQFPPENVLVLICCGSSEFTEYAIASWTVSRVHGEKIWVESLNGNLLRPKPLYWMELPPAPLSIDNFNKY